MTEKRFKLEDVGFVWDGGKLLNPYDIVDKLNEQHEQLQNYKQFVSDLIDKKLKKYPYLTLTEKWNKNCKYYHSCRENHEKNVAYASRHMLLQELKKELEEC